MMLSVIIPVYNEEKTIAAVLEKVFSVNMEKEVIVVDDGSSDGTPGILESFREKDLKVYKLPGNSGKGAAVRHGIAKASGDYIIIQDADLEYDPSDFNALIEPLINGKADAVYGDRFPKGGENMFFRQRLANSFLSRLTNVLYGSAVADMETCYKVIPADILRNIQLKSDKFNIEAELTAKLLKKGLHIENVPIMYHGRSYAEGKKIGLKDAVSAVWTLLTEKFC